MADEVSTKPVPGKSGPDGKGGGTGHMPAPKPRDQGQQSSGGKK